MSAHAVLFGESSHFGAPARFSDQVSAPQQFTVRSPREFLPRKQSTLPDTIKRLVQSTASAEGVDPALAHAVIRAESNGNQKYIISEGAVGLMQLMPVTAQRFGVTDCCLRIELRDHPDAARTHRQARRCVGLRQPRCAQRLPRCTTRAGSACPGTTAGYQQQHARLRRTARGYRG
ncbi:MAG: transglycosylase SLT domain-containing protein, partial [Gammaproteobacteria bacterium]